MIRVAFVLNLSDSWLGGVNYFRNLLCAILETPNIRISPVIFIGTKSNHELLNGFPEVEIIESDIFDARPVSRIKRIKRKIDNKLFFRDRTLDSLFKQHKIDIVSHSIKILGRMETPILGWIPDFQHRHLPRLFDKKELEYRDRTFKTLCNLSKGIIVSSYDAKNDLLAFTHGCEGHVLQFVVQPPSSDVDVAIEQLENIYGFKGKYIYLPNQFWTHKNHKVVLEALKVLKEQGREILVIATGSTEDYRNREYYGYLSEYIKKQNLSDSFMVLGQVPYSHVVSLAKHCTTLINPSLFEGWSTTVEEAKSLGKRIILSDIPVHKEQNPEGGIYFDPYKPEELAAILWRVWQSNESDTQLQVNARNNAMQKRMQFAKVYEQIILSALNKKK